MARLIDADALEEKGMEFSDTNIYVPIEAVWDAPTIDPVHAAGGIYCRECESYWKNHNGYYGCTTVGDDDFCSNGTRRKENAAPD